MRSGRAYTLIVSHTTTVYSLPLVALLFFLISHLFYFLSAVYFIAFLCYVHARLNIIGRLSLDHNIINQSQRVMA